MVCKDELTGSEKARLEGLRHQYLLQMAEDLAKEAVEKAKQVEEDIEDV